MTDCPYCGIANVWTEDRWHDHVKTCEGITRPGVEEVRAPRVTFEQVRSALQRAVGSLEREHQSGEAQICRTLLHHLADEWGRGEGRTLELLPDSYVTFVFDTRVTPSDQRPRTVEHLQLGEGPLAAEVDQRLDMIVDGLVDGGVVADTEQARVEARRQTEAFLRALSTIPRIGTVLE